MRIPPIWPLVKRVHQVLPRSLRLFNSSDSPSARHQSVGGDVLNQHGSTDLASSGIGLYEALLAQLAAHPSNNPQTDFASLADAFSTRTSFRRTRSLACETLDAASILNRIHNRQQPGPIILRGVASSWPALNRWDREYFLSRWGEAVVGAALGLPTHGVPFLEAEATLRHQLTLRAFWKEMEASGRCYIEQLPLSVLPGLDDDLRMTELVGATDRLDLNVWLGRGTRSGLHCDPRDNLITMIRGHKLVVMASSAEARRLYPFRDTIIKSQVNVERPDFARFPRAAEVEMQIGRLMPGDVLYIPAGWWHYVSSPIDDPHISVNCWFGREQSLSFFASRLLRLGPRYTARLLQDFLLGGVMGQPVVERFHSLPDGVKLYRTLRHCWIRDDSAHGESAQRIDSRHRNAETPSAPASRPADPRVRP